MAAVIVSVGIDEAGYGPKLGPLVVTATGVERPADEADLYGILAPAVVRSPRADGPPDGRARRREASPDALCVADSKVVYRPASSARRGLAGLERSVLAFLEVACGPAGRPATDLAAVRTLTTSPPQLDGLAWYGGEAEPLPVEADPEDVRGAAERLMNALDAAGCGVPAFRSRVVTAREFNAAIGRGLNKADLLVEIVAGLLASSRAAARPAGGDGPGVRVLVDHLGGRKDYTELLAKAFPGADVREEGVSPVESRYSVGSGCGVTFACRAESRCMTVALSSMVSKYLRELMMRRLNRYFTARVPGLKPTAGYPVDARRFLKDTSGFRAASGIPDEILVRAR